MKRKDGLRFGGEAVQAQGQRELSLFLRSAAVPDEDRGGVILVLKSFRQIGALHFCLLACREVFYGEDVGGGFVFAEQDDVAS